MERRSISGKYMILLGLFMDALCLFSGKGPVWPLGLATVLLEMSGAYLVFQSRRTKQ